MLRKSVFCLCPSRGRADSILAELNGPGFTGSHISVLFLDLAPRDARAASGDPAFVPSSELAPSAGEIRGVMSRIPDIRTLVIHGAEPLIAGGPVSAPWGDDTTGGIASGLIEFGISRAHAEIYEEGINKGNILIALHTDDTWQSSRARHLFASAGAWEILTMMVRSPATAFPAVGYNLSAPDATSAAGHPSLSIH